MVAATGAPLEPDPGYLGVGLSLEPRVPSPQGPPLEVERPRKVSTRPQQGGSGEPGGPRVAVVVDDLGWARAGVEELLALGLPLTFSVLPGRPLSEEHLSAVREAGHEALLHLPMEPLRGDPGAGAIYVGMSEAEIRALLRRHLEGMPGVTGVNNHMGSRATADEAVMAAVLAEVRERGLFFLDSSTTASSVVTRVGEELGVQTLKNLLFLDNIKEKEAILGRLRELAAIARDRGSAVGIAHPSAALVEALREWTSERLDVELVYLSELLEGR